MNPHVREPDEGAAESPGEATTSPLPPAPAEPAVLTARPTVKTVAALAGVSTTTVSRVLNYKADLLSDATKARVFEAARELNYKPNSMAIALRKKVSQTIGLMIPDISNPYFHQIARGAEDTAMKHGYTVIFCNTDRSASKELTYVDLLDEKRVDGVILTGGGVDGDTHLADRLHEQARVVAIGPHRLSYPSIGADDRGAIQAAVLHLVAGGRRRIACLGGQPGWLIHQERLAGYRAGLEESGITYDESLVMPSDLSIDGGQQAVESALRAGLSFDAIMSFSDYAALGAMRALKEAGLTIPDQVAIMGCDDSPLSQMVEPALSSITFPVWEFGSLATQMIVDMLNGRPVPASQVLPYQLRIRQSTAALRVLPS
ncbi:MULTISPECIES: LacI family DNA-binding transcriptional regulator [unclassified Nocardioides]|uniref:LacI family DNA-binding transcriptional regulator n=1 Tax=unclassified Nocardioides TaxID=2615069 RepID=UPI0010559361|nr:MULTISPECIES: LacI family DNA-binding transcriptional regulator [unclassified Nocardioides]